MGTSPICDLFRAVPSHATLGRLPMLHRQELSLISGIPASCSDPQSPTYPRPPRPIPAGTTLVTTRSPPPPPWRPRQPRLLEAVVTVLNLERKVVQSLLEWQAKADFHLFPLVTFVHGGLPGQSYLLPQAEEGPDLIYYFSSVRPSVR